MAAPAYSKVPTEEPVSPARIPAPDSPVYVESPRPSAPIPPSTVPVLPPSYPTVHRPPPTASICTTNEGDGDDDDDVKTININITIKIPKGLNFPCFRRRRCPRKDPAFATRGGYEIPREEKKRRFLAITMVFAYFTFLLCGAIAWGIYDHMNVYSYSHVPLALTTFTAPIDFFIVAATILLVRRFNEQKRPGFRFAILAVINIAMFILHVTIIIIAAGPWTHVYGYGWYYAGKLKAIVGLTLYSVSGMTAVKLLLGIWIFKRLAKKDGSMKRRLRAFREEIRQCIDGEEPVQHEEGDARRSQEGAVFLA
ncbi:hypothetical protein TWF569_002386 [Orbilia oligospora]|nr:hypothetical protein TWF706_000186 [Orbilia oligospora]KAF3140387.1 hypothetical protein TWF594_006358 [Orbilia oligospora]KAF3153443.1 hypothetical protein TWF569_002386 [Orbilia oligospora]